MRNPRRFYAIHQRLELAKIENRIGLVFYYFLALA